MVSPSVPGRLRCDEADDLDARFSCLPLIKIDKAAPSGALEIGLIRLAVPEQGELNERLFSLRAAASGKAAGLVAGAMSGGQLKMLSRAVMRKKAWLRKKKRRREEDAHEIALLAGSDRVRFRDRTPPGSAFQSKWQIPAVAERLSKACFPFNDAIMMGSGKANPGVEIALGQRLKGNFQFVPFYG